MRLTELNPRWLHGGGEGISYAADNAPVPRHVAGVEFDCPCGCGKRRALTFKNPEGARPTSDGWHREGNAFENLTLSPSIFAKRDALRPDNCGWHGYIKHGDVSGWIDLPDAPPVSSAPARSGGDSPHRETPMPRKLDRSRKYATTFGEDRRRFYQDGVYFDAAGEEVAADPGAQPTRNAPPLGAGKPAGKVEGEAKSTTVDSSGATPPAASEVELREQLGKLNFGQVKSMFKKAGGPEDIKGPGAQARMVDWLVANRDATVAADQQGG